MSASSWELIKLEFNKDSHKPIPDLITQQANKSERNLNFKNNSHLEHVMRMESHAWSMCLLKLKQAYSSRVQMQQEK
ncbi:CLUMA_CG017321, isoform A [Clunio marinus]|uniref:CLUMA_CG017321, isoform A n=1 Tax=Clunio marinus TaxID=568069 RepID=A0A1J1IVJ8_9DIPT|nr:CLUMA_CG017321, isoform A [Clunio marinus]